MSDVIGLSSLSVDDVELFRVDETVMRVGSVFCGRVKVRAVIADPLAIGDRPSDVVVVEDGASSVRWADEDPGKSKTKNSSDVKKMIRGWRSL